MATQLSNPTVSVNNDAQYVIPNTVMYTEGLGETETRSASAGGDEVEQIFTEKPETKFSRVKFSLPATIENIEKVKEWKVNRNENSVEISGRTPEGDFTRTFIQASIPPDIEVNLGSDTDIEIEFSSKQAV